MPPAQLTPKLQVLINSENKTRDEQLLFKIKNMNRGMVPTHSEPGGGKNQVFQIVRNQSLS